MAYRNLLAEKKPAEGAAEPKKYRNLLAGAVANPESNASNVKRYEDLAAQPGEIGRTAAQDYYMKADKGDEFAKYVERRQAQPLDGEQPGDTRVRVAGGNPANSRNMSTLAGATDWLTRGFWDEGAASIDYLRGQGDYDELLKFRRGQMDELEGDNPGDYLGGQIGGGLIDAAATFGTAPALTWLGRVGQGAAGGASSNALYEFGAEDGDIGDRLGSGAKGAVVGATIGALPGAVEGVYKGTKAGVKAATRPIKRVLAPASAAEDDIVERAGSDWANQEFLANRALARGVPAPQRRFLNEEDVLAAEGAGQRTMVSDIGGDTFRDRAKAVSNASPEASTLMRGAAAARQTDQGQRVNEVVADQFGDLNPKNVVDDLQEQARAANSRLYDAADANPNAQHIWTQSLQRAVSTPAGKKALKNAILKSRTQALRRGEEVVEPIFEEGPDGLMHFSGKLKTPSGEIVDGIEGIGINLRFWDNVKRSLDDDINEMLRAGRKSDAADLIDLKKQMVRDLDEIVPEYKTARSSAAEFFGMEDAHEAGAEYFRNMNAFKFADARAALDKMSPPERELFARGYAAELVTRVSKMGEAEDVNKLFKSKEARMKMRDALGDTVADQLEAFTHREMVQGLLGKFLGANSTTAAQILAQEGLKASASGTIGAYYTGTPMGFLYGAVGQLAVRGGFRAAQKKVIQRYAREFAELATSEDPEVIARIISRVSKDPNYLKFSRAAVNGMNRSAGQAGAAGGPRIEPRFASGGLVRKLIGEVADRGAAAMPKIDDDFLHALEATPSRGSKYSALDVLNEGATLDDEGADALEKYLARTARKKQTVEEPTRNMYPGIYGNPRGIVREAAGRVVPEDPALKQLFGVTRDDLYEMSKRKGTVKESPVKGMDKLGTSRTAHKIKTKANEGRLLDLLDEAQSEPALWKGMHSWYMMDPAYERLVALHGPEEATRLYTRFNNLTGMASPGSPVEWELQRGTAANMMADKGRFDLFDNYAGVPESKRGEMFPDELRSVRSHPYHPTAHAGPMRKYIEGGELDMGSAKVPTYIAANMPEALGSFTDLPVADAHFTRGLGYSDVRGGSGDLAGASMKAGEYKHVAPWFRDKVANEAGLESVPAQALLWGILSKETGVDTAIGAPRLELLAQGIMEASRRLGISPEEARDLILSGKAHAYRDGGSVGALGCLGGVQ